MKKTALILALLILLCSCTADRGEPDENVRWIDVYFIAEEGEIFDTERMAVSVESSITSTIKTSLEMMKVPSNSSHTSALPEGTEIKGVKFDHGVAKIELSEEYLSLTGFDKTVADSAILLTLSNFWNVQAIEISVNGEAVTPWLAEKNIVIDISKG